MRQAKRTRIPVQVQMNDNAAHFIIKIFWFGSPYELLWKKKEAFRFSNLARRSSAKTAFSISHVFLHPN